MNDFESTREWRAQVRAEKAAASDDPDSVAAYREVIRALRNAPLPLPPSGLTARCQAMPAREFRRARFERLLAGLALAALVLIGLGSSLPLLARFAGILAGSEAPWPLLVTAVAMITAGGLTADRLQRGLD